MGGLGVRCRRSGPVDVLGAVNSAVNSTRDAGSQHNWQVFGSILMLSDTLVGPYFMSISPVVPSYKMVKF